MIHFGHQSLGGSMRGRFRDQGGLFSDIAPETRVPAGHPLREIRGLVRAVLKDLGPSFGKLYASEGRPSIPPEQLLSALLLQAFYAIRSERQLSILDKLGNSSHIHAAGYLRHGCSHEQDARSCEARSETAGGRAFAAAWCEAG